MTASIEVRHLTKRYGAKTAVDDVSFSVRPGRVTGFLGPNGAGKSTTLRMIVGLDHPDAGEALVGGRRYADIPQPLRWVGALLEAGAFHPGRSAHNHVRALAESNGIPRWRVDEVIDMVGLREVARKRAGGFSLGMGQRLGIAVALLGDPEVIILDEPVNGLDPDGIRWIRELLRGLAAQGRTVLVSSHLMSEMALTADHLIVLGRGRLLADISMEEMTAGGSAAVRIASPESDHLAHLLSGDGVRIDSREPGLLTVSGRSSADIARIALCKRILLTELTPVPASLEEAYMELTGTAVEYASTAIRTSRRAAA